MSRKKAPAARCTCGGGPAHHTLEPECWCPNCLRRPVEQRCHLFVEVAPVVRQVRYVGHDHPATAKAMEDKQLPKSGSLRRQVYDWIARMGGLTDDELEYRTGRSHQSVSAIRNSLMKDALIYDSGEVRPTRYGNDAIVWKVTPLDGGP